MKLIQRRCAHCNNTGGLFHIDEETFCRYCGKTQPRTRPPHPRPTPRPLSLREAKKTPRQALQTLLPTNALITARRHRPSQLHHYRGRPVAGALNRSPVPVKPVATPRHALHLDDIVQRHPRGVNAKFSTSKPRKEKAPP